MKVEKVIEGLMVSGAIIATALVAYKLLAASKDEIKLSNLTMSDQIQLGYEVSVSVVAVNMTGTTKIREVTCIVDNQLVGFESIILQPRQSTTVEFLFIPLEIGVYSVSVDSLTQSIEVKPSALFSLSPITWDSSMPFEPLSDHIFDLLFTNTSGRYYMYHIEWTFDVVRGSCSGRIRDGWVVGVSDVLFMPEEPGIYDLPLKITIDDEFIGEFVISQVEVA